jgi:hypothetical protein
MMTFEDRDELLPGCDGRDYVSVAHWLLVHRFDQQCTDPGKFLAKLELAFPNLDEAVLRAAADYLQQLLDCSRVDRWGHA